MVPDDNEPVEPDDPIIADDSVSVKNPVLKVDISLIRRICSRDSFRFYRCRW